MLKKRYHIAVVTAALALTLTGSRPSAERRRPHPRAARSESPRRRTSADQSKARRPARIVQDSLTEFSRPELGHGRRATRRASSTSSRSLPRARPRHSARSPMRRSSRRRPPSASALGEYVEFLQTRRSPIRRSWATCPRRYGPPGGVHPGRHHLRKLTPGAGRRGREHMLFALRALLGGLEPASGTSA